MGSTWTKVGVGEGPRVGGEEEREGAREEVGIRFEVRAGKDMVLEGGRVCGRDDGRGGASLLRPGRVVADICERV